MCILCVIQKWSRKVATMLPWLVIPLIGLWLLSQFLPPAFRFEITSPRLACVLVLLITLFWYEILMPQLSSWRARRNARLRERKRFEAIEMQKLRKTAIRRCRNCLTPYRDQNPSGGKFMCSYCGHISKRPVLDLSVPPGLGRLSNSGILKDLVGKGEKMLNGKVWSDNNWICGQDWLENGGNWAHGSSSWKSSYSDHFFSEKSYSFLLVFVCKSLGAVFLGVMWVLKKLFRVSLSEDNTSTDTDIRGLSKKGDNGVNCNESKSEKARRKAEEKRQARLEREQLEEEERKQREEVAKLVEERRKLRDEKTVTEKDEEKDKIETERKRHEKKKETERNKKGDIDRGQNLTLKSNTTETGHGSKGTTVNTHNNKGTVGGRYLDRMRGNFFPSSRTLGTGGFFGKGTNANSNANAGNTREHRSSSYSDHSQNTPNKRDSFQNDRGFGKSNPHPDDHNHIRPAVFEPQPCPPPKRSWQQLFTRSSTTTTTTTTPSTTTNVISRPNGGIPNSIPPTEGITNSILLGLPYHSPSNPILPPEVEEFDNFQDPCYVLDPTSLIGPVSESLDDFQLDLGFEKSRPVKAHSEVNRPSPIESPMSRLSVSSTQSKTNLPLEEHGGGNEKEWQMWNSTPLCLDTLGLMGKPNDDPWGTMRTSYGSMSSNNNNNININNNRLKNSNLPEGIGHNVWAKNEKGAAGVSGEGAGLMMPPVAGLYSGQDVQAVWSYE